MNPNKAPVMHAFFAHSKAMPLAQVETLAAQLQTVATEKLKALHEGVVVHTGRDIYDRHQKRLGGWQSWARWVGQGGDHFQRFHMIVVPEMVVGRITVDIIAATLQRNGQVFYWTPEDGFHIVTRVEATGDASWQSRGRLVLLPHQRVR